MLAHKIAPCKAYFYVGLGVWSSEGMIFGYPCGVDAGKTEKVQPAVVRDAGR